MYRVERCIINRGYLELSDYYLWEDNFRTVVKILINLSILSIYLLFCVRSGYGNINRSMQRNIPTYAESS